MKIKNHTWPRRFLDSLVIAALPAFMYLVFGSLEVVLNNAKDFSFSFSQAIVPLCLVWLAVTVVAAAVMACMKGVGFRIATGLVTGFSLCSYLQNLLLNKDLGLLEGNEIDWSAYGNHGLYNLLLWAGIILLVLVAAILLRKYWTVAAKALSGLLLVMQASALIVSAVTAPEDVTKRYALEGKDQFTVSAQSNVIVFVLDYCANTYYDETVKVYPEIADWFADFTCYNNCDPTYIGTFPSMTHMLTGYSFDTTVTIDQWFTKAWNSESADRFYTGLSNQGYQMRLYSIVPTNIGTSYADGRISNLVNMQAKGVSSTVRFGETVLKMAKLSSFKYLPHELKRYCVLDTTDFACLIESSALENPQILDRSDFYHQLTTAGLKADADAGKLMIVQHLRGTHAPYKLGANGEKKPGATLTETARGSFLSVKEYMDQLKALGLYDDATIIITSDHGDKGNNMQVIYFIKQPGETHDEMNVNEAPVSHDDMAGTLLQAAGGDAKAQGFTTIYDWDEDDERERTVMCNAMDKKYPKVGKYGGRGQGTHTAMYAYTYEGNLKDLRKQIKRGVTQILPMTESFN